MLLSNKQILPMHDTEDDTRASPLSTLLSFTAPHEGYLHEEQHLRLNIEYIGVFNGATRSVTLQLTSPHSSISLYFPRSYVKAAHCVSRATQNWFLVTRAPQHQVLDCVLRRYTDNYLVFLAPVLWLKVSVCT
jgi:hypothetical protein